MHIPLIFWRIMRKKVYYSENKGMLYAVMLTLLFLLILGLIVGGILLFQAKGDFYSALKGELMNSVFYSAGFLLVFSSILYTPFSYGISRYFLLSKQGEAHFSVIFFLFRRPKMLLKAVTVAVLKKVMIYLERLFLLLIAALIEVLFFFLFLLVTGEDLFRVQGNPFLLAADFMLRSPLLILLTVLLWSGVLLGLFGIQLRYLLCKYMLLSFPEVSPIQAIKVGRGAIYGHMTATAIFYLRYAAIVILNLLSFGRSSFLDRSAAKRNFSVYAYELAEQGWHKYCRKRSGR